MPFYVLRVLYTVMYKSFWYSMKVRLILTLSFYFLLQSTIERVEWSVRKYYKEVPNTLSYWSEASEEAIAISCECSEAD